MNTVGLSPFAVHPKLPNTVNWLYPDTKLKVKKKKKDMEIQKKKPSMDLKNGTTPLKGIIDVFQLNLI